MSDTREPTLLERHARDHLLIVPTQLEQGVAKALGLPWPYEPKPLTSMMATMVSIPKGEAFLKKEAEVMMSRVKDGPPPLKSLLHEIAGWFKEGAGSKYTANALLYAVADSIKQNPQQIPDLIAWAKNAPGEMESCSRSIQISSVAVRAKSAPLLNAILTACPYNATIVSAMHSSIIAAWHEGKQSVSLAMRDHPAEAVALVADDCAVMRSADGKYVFGQSQRSALREAATKVYTMRMKPSDAITVIHKCAVQASAPTPLLGTSAPGSVSPAQAPAPSRGIQPHATELPLR